MIKRMKVIFGIGRSYPVYACQVRKLLNVDLWPLERVVMAISKVFLHIYFPVGSQGRLGDEAGVGGNDEGINTVQHMSEVKST